MKRAALQRFVLHEALLRIAVGLGVNAHAADAAVRQDRQLVGREHQIGGEIADEGARAVAENRQQKPRIEAPLGRMVAQHRQHCGAARRPQQRPTGQQRAKRSVKRQNQKHQDRFGQLRMEIERRKGLDSPQSYQQSRPAEGVKRKGQGQRRPSKIAELARVQWAVPGQPDENRLQKQEGGGDGHSRGSQRADDAGRMRLAGLGRVLSDVILQRGAQAEVSEFGAVADGEQYDEIDALAFGAEAARNADAGQHRQDDHADLRGVIPGGFARDRHEAANLPKAPGGGQGAFSATIFALSRSICAWISLAKGPVGSFFSAMEYWSSARSGSSSAS
ncbi:MAG: hypothetical protein BWZ10_02817 [candidate division BRC1 bacterium ADurb.BinA364]|nr:MAG: hypothetical protein BWZ10_02817 [candidate division BRC1 bacterium ADurb.BinA364]